jgi:predicted DNA binding protein
MKLAEALVELGYTEFVCGDTYDSIQWIVQPDKKPTKKQVEDMAAKIEEILQTRKTEQRATKVSAYKKLGLTEEEINAIL